MRSLFRTAARKLEFPRSEFSARLSEATLFSGTDFCSAFGRADCASASPLNGEDSIE